MFFFLSKIIGLVLNPLVWISVLLLMAIWSKNQKRKRRRLIWGVSLLMIFSNGFIYNEVITLWERDAIERSEPDSSYHYGVVLSGMVEYNAERGDFNFLRSSDRIWHAVKLCEQGTIDTILITGGAANIFAKDTSEALLLRGFLIDAGVPAEKIKIEGLSRNTHENAVFTSQLLGAADSSKILLITSASHIRRAEKCFTKVGFKCDVFATDRHSMPRRFNFDTLIIPQSGIIFNWNALFHEFFGLFTYRLMGYI